MWSGYRRNQGLFLPINAGVLTGLRDLSQGLGLEAKPYVAASRSTVDGVSDNSSDIGLDLGYSLTPSLRLAMTVNTDFAETEVDDRQVNLTREFRTANGAYVLGIHEANRGSDERR